MKEGEGVITERLLSDKDLKKIRIMKLRKAVRKVDRKGFRSSSEEEESVDNEEGEDEMMSEGGEDEMSEEGESELEEKEVEAANARKLAL